MYNMTDIWGYCKNGTTPTIVIPVIAHHGWNTLITDRAAGVLVINGSASGEPVIKHVANATPGEFPGPVYPARLVDQQRDSLNWPEGENAAVQQNFGFATTTDAESDAGDSADYLLKSKTDGHLYWVAPLKPKSTDTQTIVAYSITRADEVTTNTLNKQKVYIPQDGALTAVNLDSMKATVSQALKTTDPGFFTGSNGAAGRIAEFLPLTDTVWQVFAEQNGRVVYRIDVNVDSRVAPKVFDLTGTAAQLSGKTCDTPSKLTNTQLITCLNSIVSELNTRKLPGSSTDTTTPTPTATK